jgi:hypothetical protein
VDLTSDEEEEYTVRRYDEKARDEESEETGQVVRDPALRSGGSFDRSVVLGGDDTNEKGKRESPRKQVVILFEELGFSVPPNNHLVEVERDTESPTKVRNEEKVRESCDCDTRRLVGRNGFLISSNKSRITNNNANT